MDDTTLAKDIETLGSSPAFGEFAGATLLVTGATGLIGSLLVRSALRWNEFNDDPIKVIAVVRDESKAKRVFEGWGRGNDLHIVAQDISTPLEIDGRIDWISHGASITSSAAFAKQPVEVSLTEIDGTRNLLELARKHDVQGFVYLSSLEVYGDVAKDHGEVFEHDCATLDRLKARNSYPAAKRMCESLCASYASEYGVPAKIARLAQTFGAGVAPDDQRVFAQFARAALSGAPITLHTPGEGRRCYCYTTDAVEGLLAILQHGSAGEAYNVSNPETYCSVREMADMVVDRYRQTGTTLNFDYPADLSSYGFATPSYVKLNSDKLASLGWKPKVQLPEMYDRLISSMRQTLDIGAGGRAALQAD